MAEPAGDDIVSGCVRYLRGVDELARIFANPADADDPLISDARPTDAELAGNLACVVSWLGPAGSGNQHNTYAQERVQIELWCSPAAGMVEDVGEGRNRIWHAGRAIDEHLHRPWAQAQMWGDIRTCECVRLAGITPYEIPDSGGMWRGTAVYSVGVG